MRPNATAGATGCCCRDNRHWVRRKVPRIATHACARWPCCHDDALLRPSCFAATRLTTVRTHARSAQPWLGVAGCVVLPAAIAAASTTTACDLARRDRLRRCGACATAGIARLAARDRGAGVGRDRDGGDGIQPRARYRLCVACRDAGDQAGGNFRTARCAQPGRVRVVRAVRDVPARPGAVVAGPGAARCDSGPGCTATAGRPRIGRRASRAADVADASFRHGAWSRSGCHWLWRRSGCSRAWLRHCGARRNVRRRAPACPTA